MKCYWSPFMKIYINNNIYYLYIQKINIVKNNTKYG